MAQPNRIKIPQGATLSSIARQQGTTVANLMAANPQITNPNVIKAGATLNLTTGTPQTPAPVSSPATPRSQPLNLISPPEVANRTTTPQTALNINRPATQQPQLQSPQPQIQPQPQRNIAVQPVSQQLPIAPVTTNELPHQTFTRVTGQRWTGGTSPSVVSLLQAHGITAQPGTVEANQALQRALLGGQAQTSQGVLQNPLAIANENFKQKQEQELEIDRDEFPLRRPIEDFVDRMERTQLPQIPNMALQFSQLREQMGVLPLENELADVNRRIAETKALYEGQINREEDRTVPLAIIERRQSALGRQLQTELNSLNLEKAAVSEQLSNRLNTVSTMMELNQWSFQQASAQFNQEHNRQIQLFNLMQDVTEKEMNWEQKREADSKANFTILANNLGKAYGSWNSVPQDKQVQARQLAMQAGIPEIMLPYLIQRAEKEIRAQIISDDKTMMTILYEDGTTRTLQTGLPEAKRATNRVTQAEILSEGINITMAQLQQMAGRDGFVSPENWNAMKKNWINLGFDPDRFISQFYIFINPSHPQDYGIREARYIGGARGLDDNEIINIFE